MNFFSVNITRLTSKRTNLHKLRRRVASSIPRLWRFDVAQLRRPFSQRRLHLSNHNNDMSYTSPGSSSLHSNTYQHVELGKTVQHPRRLITGHHIRNMLSDQCWKTAMAHRYNLNPDSYTRSSPQWWSGRSTTPREVLNLWSPIYGPSVWGTWRSGWTHLVARTCIPISSLLTHMVYLSTVFEFF